MIKSDALIRLEKAGVFFHTKDGLFNGYNDGVDLTPYLLEAGMFEH